MKLTNYNRDHIARVAVETSFAERKAALDAAEDALAREAYNFIVPQAEQKLIAKLPDHWFRDDNCLRYNVGGQDITLCVQGKGLPAPYRAKGSDRGGYNCNRIGVIPPGDLCDRIQANAVAKEVLRTQRYEAKSKVKTLLNSVTTIGKLREVWPEGEPFYSTLETSAPASLPAIRVQEVNAALGLAA